MSARLKRWTLLAAALSMSVAGCLCFEADPSHACAQCRPFVSDAHCPAGLLDDALNFEEALAPVFDAYDRAFDEERFEEAFACAQLAARADPDRPGIHLDRALALEALGEFEEAQTVYLLALALDPEDPFVLRALADFHVRGTRRDGWEAAYALARRGRMHVESLEIAAELAGIEAEAANLLGRPRAALRAAESALILDAERTEAQVERAVALFELLRFEDAARVFEGLVHAQPTNARVAWVLGLIRERQGREREAGELLSRAAELDPHAYPPSMTLSADRFCSLVQAEVRRLPEADRARLSRADLRCEELPALEDLAAGEPTLSPTIVGLFRPGDGGVRDTVVLYRRNLLRTVTGEAELRREIRTTLLHEIGHLEGMTDDELRDRGL